jgi:hypothetical protein
VPDLIAQARAVESMYLKFKRQTRAGMKQFMLIPVPLYERSVRFRIYEHHAIPGLFQTGEYMRAMLQFGSASLRHGTISTRLWQPAWSVSPGNNE